MKKKFFLSIIFIFIFIVSCNHKQQKNVDKGLNSRDLHRFLSEANSDSLPPSIRLESNKKALKILMSQENDSINRVLLLRTANRFFNLNNLPEYESTVRKLLANSKVAKDTFYIAKSYSYLGDYYGGISRPDSAYSYYFKAEKMFLKIDDFYNVGRTRFNKGSLQYNLNDFIGSEIAIFNALKAVQGRDGKDLIFDCYNVLGVIYSELGEYDKSIEYNKKAFESITDHLNAPQTQARAMSLNNMGLVFQSMKDHKKAIEFFEKGLKQPNLEHDRPLIYAILLENLGYSRMKLDIDDGVYKLFFKALAIRNNLGMPAGAIVNKIRIAEYFARKLDTVKAIQYSNEALATAEESNNRRNELAPLKQLSILQPQLAAKYTSTYMHISDSVQKAERSIGNKFTRIEYETDKIKDEYSDLEDKNRNLIYIFSFFAILGLFFYVIKIQRARHRELLYKQGQQQANAEIYNLIINQQSNIDANRVIEKKRVAQELHDGVLGRMFGVRMNLEGLNSFQDELAVTQRKEYIIELKKIEQDIREISHEMNREKSELINNFVAIVNNLFEEQRKTFQTKLVTTIDRTINWELASNIVKINLYRIIQESLQNCNKYAKAKTIKVELKKVDGDIHLLISDDGKGFNMKVLKRGIGLKNMISRAKECQGNLNILSNKGEGTTITLVIPLEQKQIPA